MKFTIDQYVIFVPGRPGTAGVKIKGEKIDSFDDNRIGMENKDAEDAINECIQRHAKAAFEAGIKWARKNTDK